MSNSDKSDKIFEQYRKVLDLILEDAKNEWISVFGYIYFREWEAIKDMEILEAKIVSRIYNPDAWYIEKAIKDLLDPIIYEE